MHFFFFIVQVVGAKNQVKKIVVVKDHQKIEADQGVHIPIQMVVQA